MSHHTVSARIAAYNANRLPHIIWRKYQKMAADPFLFYRGTAHLFYEDLSQALNFPASPAAWLCGDLHPENFGSYKGDNRQVYFDLSDFDEGLLGPALWDVVRMTAGIFVAFASLHLSGGAEAAQHYLHSYGNTLKRGKALRLEAGTATGIVKKLLENVSLRKREKWLEKRTTRKAGRLIFREVAGKQLPLEDERLKKDLLRHLAAHPLCVAGASRFAVLDVCARLAGTGSLGVKRYLFLLEAVDRRNKHYLLDMKQCNTSCLAPYIQVSQPQYASEAERVVQVEDRMLAVDRAMLTTTIFNGDAYKLEEMQPTEDKVALLKLKDVPEKRSGLLADAGVLTASAQLRSAGRKGSANADELIAFGEATNWQDAVLTYARQYAAHVQKDYACYREDFAKGFFGTG